ncbi:MAG: protein kinase domain-containing protein, partial [bacterium]
MERQDECLDPDDLVALLHGRLAPASQRAMEMHIAACSDCRKLVSALAQAESGLRLATLTAERASVEAVPPSDRHAELAPGTLVGRYVVTTRLGAGAMGVVFAAHDPELDRKVAIKVLNHAPFAGGEGEPVPDRLRREAQAMALLAHPNVVTVYDVGTIDDCIFIAMELIEGCTLARWLAGGRRSWREVVAMFLLAGRGLAAAHTAGLVHRDFKPDNVLVGDDGRVRVADFGFARMLEPQESTCDPGPSGGSTARFSSALGLVGTPYYMAPEQARGENVDHR